MTIIVVTSKKNLQKTFENYNYKKKILCFTCNCFQKGKGYLFTNTVKKCKWVISPIQINDITNPE